jgi:hypothetical protein
MYLPDTKHILQFKVTDKQLVDLYPQEYPEYSFYYLTKDNYHYYKEDLELIIEYHHKDLDWDGTPTYEVLERRFEAGSTCYLMRYNNVALGWGWSNRRLTFDWINIVSDIPKDGMYGGGTFVTRSIDRPARSGIYYTSKWYQFLFKHENLKYMYGYIDEWNRGFIRMNYHLGWKKEEWMKLYF